MNGSDLRLLLLLLALSASYVCVWVTGVEHGYRAGLAGEVRTWSLLSGSQ